MAIGNLARSALRRGRRRQQPRIERSTPGTNAVPAGLRRCGWFVEKLGVGERADAFAELRGGTLEHDRFDAIARIITTVQSFLFLFLESR